MLSRGACLLTRGRNVQGKSLKVEFGEPRFELATPRGYLARIMVPGVRQDGLCCETSVLQGDQSDSQVRKSE